MIPVLSFLFSWKNIHSEKAQGEVENYLCYWDPELIEDRLSSFSLFFDGSVESRKFDLSAGGASFFLAGAENIL